MPILPTSWYKGRGAMSGPAIGGYVMWNFGPYTQAGTVTDEIGMGFVAPCDLRLSKITYQDQQNPTAGTIAFYKNTSAGGFALGGATILHATATLSFSTTGAVVLPATEAAATDYLVEAARNISRGDCVFSVINITDSTADLNYLNIQWLCWITGHPNVKETSD